MTETNRRKPLPLKDLSKPVEDEICQTILDYTVALAAYRDDDPSTFRAMGSGTFIQHGNDFGILTAHHCIHRPNIPVSLGPQGRDVLSVCLTRGRTMVIKPHEVVEVPLAVPGVEEFGPDLTFIKFVSKDRLNTVRGYSSFWRIDEAHKSRAASLVLPGTFTVSSGFPSEQSDTYTEGKNIHYTICHQSFLGSLDTDRIFHHDEWDFLDSQTDRVSSPKLPETFAGVSGGGVWLVGLREKADKSLVVEDLALAGVSFFEIGKVDHLRLRAHFIDSIYSLAWRARL